MPHGLVFRGGQFVDNRTQPGAERSGDWEYQTLLLVDGVAHGETLAPLLATAAEDCATPTIFHACAESMSVVTLAVVRLECSFHDSKPLGYKMLALKSFWNPKDSKLLQIRKGAPKSSTNPRRTFCG